MAISAQFLANFDQFVGETKRADAALHGLGTSATKVATDSASSFAGMGTTVRNLAGAFGVGLSIGAVVSFGKSVFDAASTIHDMALKLGISAEAVQGFKHAATQAGSSIEAVGTAITRMNVNLAEGSKGTVGALTAAGLQFSAIRAMKPEDAFLAIADAIQKIPDPMVRSDVALQLFGKSAAELLPAIMEGFREAADGASKMSNETIDSLERAQDAWGQLSTKVTIVTGEMIASSLDFLEWYGRVADAWSTGGQVAAKAAGDIELLPPVLEKTTEALVEEEVALKKTRSATDALADAATRAAQKQAAAMEELRVRGEGWQVTLSKMDQATIAAVTNALTLGASHSTIAAALGVTDLQLEAVVKSLKDVEASMEAAAEADEVFRTGLTFTSEVVGELVPKLDEAAAKVKALAEAEAHAANQRQGGSFTVPTVTVTETNRASLEAELARIEAGYQMYAGRQAGVNGTTGLLSGDDAGWLRMLAEQRRYASLTAALGNSFAQGTRGYQNFGSGQLAMLHGWEKVTPLGRGSDGGVTIMPGAIVIQGSVLSERELLEKLKAALVRAILQGQKVAA